MLLWLYMGINLKMNGRTIIPFIMLLSANEYATPNTPVMMSPHLYLVHPIYLTPEVLWVGSIVLQYSKPTGS